MSSYFIFIHKRFLNLHNWHSVTSWFCLLCQSLIKNSKNSRIIFLMKMEQKHKLIMITAIAISFGSVMLLLIICFCRRRAVRNGPRDVEESFEFKEEDETDQEELIKFQGGEDLTLCDILEAPGEVIGKSSYGTLYRATLLRTNEIALLRFLRPICTGRMKEMVAEIQLLGSIRHPNLVPLYAFYAGPRGEKLMVHRYYHTGTLAHFIRDGNGQYHKWNIIYGISVGIARGLDYLHNGMERPIIHGNLKSMNILLDRNYQPHVSDYSLYLLLNPTAGQEMLEASSAKGYKAPELIKMKDASEETDIYSLGVILLELLTAKEPISENPTPDQDFYLPDFMRHAILDRRITDLYHPGILVGQSHNQSPITEERILTFFQLAMACCSPYPSLRPDIKQILRKLEEIGK